MDKKLLIPAMMISVILLAGMASAATWTTPLTGESLYGASFDLNVTTTMVNVTNCSVIIASTAATANSSSTVVNETLTNASMIDGRRQVATLTINTNDWEDGSDYTMTGTCHNSSEGGMGATEDITSITVNVDNHIPPAATSLSPADDTRNTDGTVDFSATVTDANVTGCTLIFTAAGRAFDSKVMAYSGTTCSISDVALPNAVGEPYEWTIRTTDGLNTTDGSANTLKVDVQSVAGKAVVAAQQEQEALAAGKLPGGIIIIAALAGLFLLKGKKKKR